jgi:N-acetylmuramoyl-L-alanine amidase
MRVSAHRLSGPRIVQIPSPNHGDFFAPGMQDTIIMHYTAGDTAIGAVEHLCNPSAEVSAHLVVSEAGEVYQLVPFNKIAWHAGKSYWQGRESLNRYSIGIEIDNAGKLEKINSKFYSWFGREYHEEQVFVSTSGEYWHKFSANQLDVVEKLVDILLEHYEISEILGHDEVAPDRKIDPGPAFPMKRFRSKLLK